MKVVTVNRSGETGRGVWIRIFQETFEKKQETTWIQCLSPNGKYRERKTKSTKTGVISRENPGDDSAKKNEKKIGGMPGPTNREKPGNDMSF